MRKYILLLLLCLVLMIPSCTMPEQDTSCLVGRVYVNEETSEKIEFVGERKFAITFDSSDFHLAKGVPRTFKYVIIEQDNQLKPISMTSGEALLFPYRALRFSDSKEEIFFTEKRSNKSGVFKRIK